MTTQAGVTPNISFSGIPDDQLIQTIARIVLNGQKEFLNSNVSAQIECEPNNNVWLKTFWQLVPPYGTSAQQQYFSQTVTKTTIANFLEYIRAPVILVNEYEKSILYPCLYSYAETLIPKKIIPIFLTPALILNEFADKLFTHFGFDHFQDIHATLNRLKGHIYIFVINFDLSVARRTVINFGSLFGPMHLNPPISFFVFLPRIEIEAARKEFVLYLYQNEAKWFADIFKKNLKTGLQKGLKTLVNKHLSVVLLGSNKAVQVLNTFLAHTLAQCIEKIQINHLFILDAKDILPQNPQLDRATVLVNHHQIPNNMKETKLLFITNLHKLDDLQNNIIYKYQQFFVTNHIIRVVATCDRNQLNDENNLHALLDWPLKKMKYKMVHGKEDTGIMQYIEIDSEPPDGPAPQLSLVNKDEQKQLDQYDEEEKAERPFLPIYITPPRVRQMLADIEEQKAGELIRTDSTNARKKPKKISGKRTPQIVLFEQKTPTSEHRHFISVFEKTPPPPPQSPSSGFMINWDLNEDDDLKNQWDISPNLPLPKPLINKQNIPRNINLLQPHTGQFDLYAGQQLNLSPPHTGQLDITKIYDKFITGVKSEEEEDIEPRQLEFKEKSSSDDSDLIQHEPKQQDANIIEQQLEQKKPLLPGQQQKIPPLPSQQKPTDKKKPTDTQQIISEQIAEENQPLQRRTQPVPSVSPLIAPTTSRLPAPTQPIQPTPTLSLKSSSKWFNVILILSSLINLLLTGFLINNVYANKAKQSKKICLLLIVFMVFSIIICTFLTILGDENVQKISIFGLIINLICLGFYVNFYWNLIDELAKNIQYVNVIYGAFNLLLFVPMNANKLF